jgi:hypothetical protein|tara:strand:+ start:228 stop:461 length:234 start_codon:yes stop_codon:yes gene_type:complete
VEVVEDMTVQQYEEEVQEDQVVVAQAIYLQQEHLELVVKVIQVVMVYIHKVVVVEVDFPLLVVMALLQIQVEQVGQV